MDGAFHWLFVCFKDFQENVKDAWMGKGPISSFFNTKQSNEWVDHDNRNNNDIKEMKR